MMKIMRTGEENGKAKARAATKEKLEKGADANFQCVAALVLIGMAVGDAKMTSKLAKIELHGAGRPSLLGWDISHFLRLGFSG